MSKKVFDQIAEGLEEAIAVARGEAKPFRLHVPAEINVKEIRGSLNLSQRDFAYTFGFGLDQVKQWEQGRSRPLDGSRAYLLLIKNNPAVVVQMLNEIRAAEAAPKRAVG